MPASLTLICGLTAVLAYLVCTGLLLVRIRQNRPTNTVGHALPALALASHAIATLGLIHLPAGYDLGFFKVSSLIFVLLVLIGWLSSLRLPMRSLLVVIYPLAALSLGLALITPDTYQPREFPWPIALHIFLSILAYSVITLATLQAIALALQDYLLRRHRSGLLASALPSLQVMETLLFSLIAIGFGLLSGAILSGFLFVENLLAQHLLHKTVFSLIAWWVYAILLWGRHFLGWRSQTALRWTLAGFIALMLAFFGTKFVLELLLQRA